MNSSSDYPDIITTVVHSSLPEMIFLCIPETTHESRQLIGEVFKQLALPSYRKQLAIECLQGGYEYIHFLGLCVPKLIDCYREQGLISRTSIPKYSKGWWGRIILSVSDTLLGYHVRTKGFGTVLHGISSIFAIESTTPQYISMLVISSLCSKAIYLGIVKKADLKTADHHLKTILFDIHDVDYTNTIPGEKPMDG